MFNGPFSGTTRVSQYQKGKTNLDFTDAKDSEWQWRQLGRMQVCTSLQTDNHASTPPLSFLQSGCPSCRPTNSVKAWDISVSSLVTVCTGADMQTVQLLRKVCAEVTANINGAADRTAALQAASSKLDTLFFEQKPTQVWYLLEVAYSLLMPAHASMMDEIWEFQVCLIKSSYYSVTVLQPQQKSLLHQQFGHCVREKSFTDWYIKFCLLWRFFIFWKFIFLF